MSLINFILSFVLTIIIFTGRLQISQIIDSFIEQLEEYIQSFNKIHANYRKDVKLTADQIEVENKAKNLKKFYSTFYMQIAIIDNISLEKRLVFFNFNQSPLKENLLLAYKNNIDLLSKSIPKLFGKNVVILNAQANVVMEKLEIKHPPHGFLNLNEIRTEIDYVKGKIEDFYEIYQLMKAYHVDVQDEIKEEFMGKLIKKLLTLF